MFNFSTNLASMKASKVTTGLLNLELESEFIWSGAALPGRLRVPSIVPSYKLNWPHMSSSIVYSTVKSEAVSVCTSQVWKSSEAVFFK